VTYWIGFGRKCLIRKAMQLVSSWLPTWRKFKNVMNLSKRRGCPDVFYLITSQVSDLAFFVDVTNLHNNEPFKSKFLFKWWSLKPKQTVTVRQSLQYNYIAYFALSEVHLISRNYSHLQAIGCIMHKKRHCVIYMALIQSPSSWWDLCLVRLRCSHQIMILAS